MALPFANELKVAFRLGFVTRGEARLSIHAAFATLGRRALAHPDGGLKRAVFNFTGIQLNVNDRVVAFGHREKGQAKERFRLIFTAIDLNRKLGAAKSRHLFTLVFHVDRDIASLFHLVFVIVDGRLRLFSVTLDTVASRHETFWKRLQKRECVFVNERCAGLAEAAFAANADQFRFRSEAGDTDIFHARI